MNEDQESKNAINKIFFFPPEE